MKILKFGGTSVGSPERMKKLLDVISLNLSDSQTEERKIVVLSAVAGTTNSLVEISTAYLNGDKRKAGELTKALHEQYKTFIKELFNTEEGLKNGRDLIDYHFTLISSFANELFTPIEEKIILAQGELISTTLYHFYLTEIGVRSVLLPALEFMKIDEDNEPIVEYIGEHLQRLLSKYPDQTLFITQ